jgi:hypothetical protein
VFHTLAALNEAITEMLERLNSSTMRSYGKSRRELFESLERGALLPLPVDRYAITYW